MPEDVYQFHIYMIEHGRRVREILKQDQFSPLTAAEQVAVLFAVNEGLLDDLELGDIRACQERIADLLAASPDLSEQILTAEKEAPLWQELKTRIAEITSELGRSPDADA